MTSRQKQIAQQAEAYWKDHVATYQSFGTADESEIEYLRWGAKDGSCFYLANFYMHHGCLIVTGDMYNAVFRFNTKWTMKDVAQCDSYYFMRALEAGPHGRDGTEWDSEAAEVALKSILADDLKREEEDVRYEAEGRLCNDKDFTEDPTDEEWEAGLQKYIKIVKDEREESKVSIDDPFDHLSNEEEWHAWLSTQAAEDRFRGDQWHHGGIGRTTAYCHIWQFHAFKEAMKQLQAAPV
jgi:hypothetical protein